jgi:hypothetical protein
MQQTSYIRRDTKPEELQYAGGDVPLECKTTQETRLEKRIQRGSLFNQIDALQIYLQYKFCWQLHGILQVQQMAGGHLLACIAVTCVLQPRHMQ